MGPSGSQPAVIPSRPKQHHPSPLSGRGLPAHCIHTHPCSLWLTKAPPTIGMPGPDRDRDRDRDRGAPRDGSSRRGRKVAIGAPFWWCFPPLLPAAFVLIFYNFFCLRFVLPSRLEPHFEAPPCILFL